MSHTPPAGTVRRRALATLGLAGLAVAGSQAVAGTASAAPARKHDDPEATVNSVADLRTTTPAADGQQVQLLGYHGDLPGRGGGPSTGTPTAPTPTTAAPSSPSPAGRPAAGNDPMPPGWTWPGSAGRAPAPRTTPRASKPR